MQTCMFILRCCHHHMHIIYCDLRTLLHVVHEHMHMSYAAAISVRSNNMLYMLRHLLRVSSCILLAMLINKRGR